MKKLSKKLFLVSMTVATMVGMTACGKKAKVPVAEDAQQGIMLEEKAKDAVNGANDRLDNADKISHNLDDQVDGE